MLPGRLQLEFEVEDVGELHFEAVGAAPVVAEVHLAQGLGGDLAEVVLVDACFLGLEEAGGVVGRQGDAAAVSGLAAGERLVTRGAAEIRRASLLSTGAPEGHVH